MQPGAGQEVLGRFVTYIIDPAILLIFTAGFLLFLFGLVEFLFKVEQSSGRENGVRHMIWGMVGMLIMVSVYGIVALITNTFGLDLASPDVSRANDIVNGFNF